MAEEKLENMVRWTITLPLSLAIKIDIERKITNDTKSSWIRKALEKRILDSKDVNINKTDADVLQKLMSEVKDLKQQVAKSTKNKES